MSENDLRSAFPLNGHKFFVHHQHWICQLVEVSDLRPESDRLSWYLVFRTASNTPDKTGQTRRLEIVTDANRTLRHQWQPDLEQRIVDWLTEGGEDDRVEWIDG